MLSVAHMPTGAFIATVIPNPYLSIPLALAAHFVEDWIPHYDTGVFVKQKKHKKIWLWTLGITDLAAAFGLVYWWFQAGQTEIQWIIWLAAIACITPELLDAPQNFLGKKVPFISPLIDKISDFHEWIHHSTPKVLLGIIPQLIVLLTIYLLK